MGTVRTTAHVAEIVSDIRALGLAPIAIDTETTGLNMYAGDTMRGMSLAYGERSWYVPVGYPGSQNFDPQPIYEALNQHTGVQVFHNAVGVDWAGMQATGGYVVPDERHYADTQVMAWLHDENNSLKLKELGTRWFKDFDAKAEKAHIDRLFKGRNRSDIYRELREDPEWKQRPAAEARSEAARISDESKKSWDTLTLDDTADYAELDTIITLRLYEVYSALPGNPPVRSAYPREFAFQRVIFEMSKLGIRVDRGVAEQQWKVAQSRHDELAGQFDGVNLNSPKQLASLIYDEWGLPCHAWSAAGNRSTARQTLEEMEALHPGIDALMEYRKLDKSISGYYQPLTERLDVNSRVHTSFSSARTVLGRLSSSNPNLQTIPRGDVLSGVRDLFIPTPGWELWELDLSQAELRVIASLANETSMIEAIDQGRDLHSETAAVVFGPDFRPIQRRVAKNLNFSVPYFVGPKKLSNYYVIGTGMRKTQCPHWSWTKDSGQKRPSRCRKCHVCQAAVAIDGWKESNSNIARLMKGLDQMAAKLGYLPHHVEGRYRHFRGPMGVQVPTYTALNAVVQGGVAELMKDVMLTVVEQPLEARMVLQVHDSLVFEVQPGYGLELQQKLQAIVDDLNPYRMRMVFDAQPWSSHA